MESLDQVKSDLSIKMNLIKPSSSNAVTAIANKLRSEGKEICVLSIGEPDFDTPDHIKQIGIRAIVEGKTKYTVVDGISELKNAIINKFWRENQLSYNSNQICVGTGAKQVLFNLLMATINFGDEVIIPAPFYDSYEDMVNIFGGVSIIVKCEGDFKLTADQLKRNITKSTKWLILNSPNNPSGAVYTRVELKALSVVLLEHPHVNIISDDIYEHIIYGEPFFNIVQVEAQLYNRVFVVNGISKAYAMTGWRIGYIVGRVDVVQAVTRLQTLCTTSPNTMAQIAAVEALNGDQSFLTERIMIYKNRRDFMIKELNSMQGLSVAQTGGAFYLFVSCKGIINKLTRSGKCIASDTDFIRYLLEDHLVAVMPGSIYGIENYIRICYAYSTEQLQIGCQRIREACQALVSSI